MTTAEQTELLKAAKWAFGRATLRGNEALASEVHRASRSIQMGNHLTVAERCAIRRLGARRHQFVGR